MKTKTFTLALIFITQLIFAQVTGIWTGDMDMQGNKLPLVFDIKSENGGYKTFVYSPKQTDRSFPAEETFFTDNTLTVKIGMIGAEYSGKLDGEMIDGNFSQNGKPSIFKLHKISEAELKKMLEGNAPQKLPKVEIAPIGNREIDSKKLDDYLNYIAENKQGIGSVSIFRHGREIYRKDFGQDQISATYNKDTEYQIGSISKLFTALMLMQQVEKGKLKLTDKLSKFYPDMPNADKITIESMMNHTSGLGNYNGESSWLMRDAVGNTAILDRIKKDGAVFQPGERMEYSNSAYFLLSRILEKVGGKPYNVLLKENITAKAGMNNTFSVLDNPKNIFKGYEFKDNSWQPIQDYNFRNIVGLGDMSSTTTDLNIFINALFQGKLLKKVTFQQMLPTTEEFGLGVMAAPFYNVKSYGHGGTTRGTHSLVTYDPQNDLSIAQTINGERMPNMKIAGGLLSIMYNAPFKLPKF